MKKSIFIKVIISSLVLSFYGCNTYYDAEKTYYKNNETIITNSEYLNFNTPIKINFNGTITNDSKSYRVIGIIKVKSFSNYQIFISSKTLGIEIARMEFFGDSIIFINKILKTSVKSKIANISYLKGLQLDSDMVIRLLTGRSFVGLNYNNNLNSNLYNYRNLSNSGVISFNNFGYIKSHDITVGTSKIMMQYDNYYKKYKLPYNIIADVYGNNSEFSCNIKYTTISPLKGNYRHLSMPKVN